MKKPVSTLWLISWPTPPTRLRVLLPTHQALEMWKNEDPRKSLWPSL